MHVVPDIGALHPEDYILGDVGGVISNPLQVAGHEQGIQSLPHNLGPLVHRLDQLDEGVVAHAAFLRKMTSPILPAMSGSSISSSFRNCRPSRIATTSCRRTPNCQRCRAKSGPTL